MKIDKFWRFQNINENEAELLIYGEIVASKWFDDEVGCYEFIKELKELGDNVININVRINSIGGDVFSAHAIYNQLKHHKANITVYIDGISASASTIIQMAGDIVKMPSNSLLMIHNPTTTILGRYDKTMLEKKVSALEKVKKSIVNAYISKTKLDEKILNKLMDKETWLTSDEAKEYGFIDEILDENIAPQVNNKNELIINNIKHDISRFQNKDIFLNMYDTGSKNNILDDIRNIVSDLFNKFQKNNNLNIENNDSAYKNISKTEVLGMDIKNIVDLENKFPELVKEVKNKAIEEERERIKNIESIQNNIDPKLVYQAKFEKPIDSKELAFKSLQENSKKGSQYLDNSLKDSNNSGANDITGAPIVTQQNQQQKDDELKKEEEKFINIIAGGK